MFVLPVTRRSAELSRQVERLFAGQCEPLNETRSPAIDVVETDAAYVVMSFGLAVAGARDGAFVSPLQGKARIGAFLGWGQAKIAVLGGRERRVIVTRQFQVVPWVF